MQISEGGTKFGQWELTRILVCICKYYGKIGELVVVKQLPRTWRNSVLSALVCWRDFW